MESFTKEQILAALIPVYNAAYDEYIRLTDLSIQLLDEDRAYRAIARKATQKSHFMDGMKAAAAALGITLDEFLGAAAYQNGKEDAKCQS